MTDLLQKLRERGPSGVTSGDFPHGFNLPLHIDKLREQGYFISTVKDQKVSYVLVGG